MNLDHAVPKGGIAILQRRLDQLRVEDRIGLARAIEQLGGKTLQPMVAKLKAWMLARDEQQRRNAEGSESMGNRA